MVEVAVEIGKIIDTLEVGRDGAGPASNARIRFIQ